MFLKIRYLECAYVCTIKKLKRDKTPAVNFSLMFNLILFYK